MAMFDDLRAAWGARNSSNKPTSVNPSRRTEFMNHYDGGAPLNLATHADCLARVRQNQAFHMDGRGWSDIGYNGLICQHGRAIEGRGIDYAGAHCPDHNTVAYGWQFMVGGSQVPTPAAYARMAQAYADCAARSGHALRKLGHRDGFATECPGDEIQAWVKAGMPAPTTDKDWFDMATIDELREAAGTGVLGATIGRTGLTVGVVLDRLYSGSIADRATIAALTAAVTALAEEKGADADAITAAVVTKINDLQLTLTPKEL